MRKPDNMAIKGIHACGNKVTMIIEPNKEETFKCLLCGAKITALLVEHHDYKTLDITSRIKFDMQGTERVAV